MEYFKLNGIIIHTPEIITLKMKIQSRKGKHSTTDNLLDKEGCNSECGEGKCHFTVNRKGHLCANLTSMTFIFLQQFTGGSTT